MRDVKMWKRCQIPYLRSLTCVLTSQEYGEREKFTLGTFGEASYWPRGIRTKLFKVAAPQKALERTDIAHHDCAPSLKMPNSDQRHWAPVTERKKTLRGHATASHVLPHPRPPSLVPIILDTVPKHADLSHKKYHAILCYPQTFERPTARICHLGFGPVIMCFTT